MISAQEGDQDERPPRMQKIPAHGGDSDERHTVQIRVSRKDHRLKLCALCAHCHKSFKKVKDASVAWYALIAYMPGESQMKRPVRTPSPPPRGLDDLVPWKDYARLCFLPALGLSTRFLDKEVKAGRLRCIRFGRKKFGTQRHADQYMREKCLVQQNPPDSGLSPQNSMTMAPSAGALDTGSKIQRSG